MNIKNDFIKLLSIFLKVMYYFVRSIFKFIAVIFVWMFNFKTRKIHGSAKWAGPILKKKLLNLSNDGLVIDGINRINLENSFRHCAIIAPTGAGKTSSYIIPNVLQLSHSMVITDPSGEIYTNTCQTLSHKGFDIRCINVQNFSKSHFYNPLSRANTETDVKKLTEILIRNAYKKNDNNGQEFWNNQAKSILNIIIRVVLKEAPKYRNLYNVRQLLNMYGLTKFESIVQNNADNNTYNEFLGFENQDEKVTSGAISTAKAALEPFSDTKLCQMTSKETLQFEDIRNKPVAIFLIIPEHEIRYYSFLCSLLYSQLFNYCSKNFSKNMLPVFFLLDEFGNIGNIPDFETYITTLRKRACSISIILQDIKQIKKNYGADSDSTIINGGCTGKLFFSGLGIETCKYVENLLGKQTIYDFDISGKRQKVGRSLLTADEIRRMKKNEAIYVFGNQSPVKLKITPYY